jgi:hypothetical protein
MSSVTPGVIYIAQPDGTYRRAVIGDHLWDLLYCITEDRFKTMEDLKEVLPHIHEAALSRVTY